MHKLCYWFFFVLLKNIKYMQFVCYCSKTLDGYTETSKFSMFLTLIVREILILKNESVLHYWKETKWENKICWHFTRKIWVSYNIIDDSDQNSYSKKRKLKCEFRLFDGLPCKASREGSKNRIQNDEELNLEVK